MLLICITVFLSYLPEAGQYSSFFLYLRQVSVWQSSGCRKSWPIKTIRVVSPVPRWLFLANNSVKLKL